MQVDLEEAVSEDALERAFTRLCDRHFDVIKERVKISAGADRVQLQHFSRDRKKHFAAIARKVLDDRYTFAPYLEREIPKAESKELRTISLAGIRDSLVQRVAYDMLYEHVDVLLTESVYGYRRGNTAQAAVAEIRRHFQEGRVFVFDADFQKFFDNIDHDLLLEKVGELGVDPRVGTLVRRFVKTRFVLPTDVAADQMRRGKQRAYPSKPRVRGVPQGGVLSGLLTNLYLADFDRAVRAMEPGYVRYADDFVVCCNSESSCRALHAQVEGLAKAIRVTLHPSKTNTCRDASYGVEFLGFKIWPDRLAVGPKNITRFKTRIRSVIDRHERKYKYTWDTSRLLHRLCNSLAFKIRGPDAEHRAKLIALGTTQTPHRRSWIGFFRDVDDLDQIRDLDRWVRSQVSAYMWHTFKKRVTLKDMQAAGLPSLINHLHRARKPLPPGTPSCPANPA